MPSTIVTKNSSTAAAVPSAGSLTQGELAVNVTDKKLYTKDSGGTVVELTGLKSSDIGVSVQAYDADLTTLGAGGASARTFLGLAIGTDVQAYNANNAVTNAVQTFTSGQRGEITALTDGSTITPDLADSNNFSVTLGGNRTLANPSNIVAGQSGSFFITQDGTGSRTLAYGSNYDFAGGTAPTLSTAASAVDRIDYVVRTSTSIHCVFTANYS
jgi:hypothetical protein